MQVKKENKQLLETIKCFDGKFFNLSYHQARFDLARKHYFSSEDSINLSKILSVPEEFKKGLFRCRVLYTHKIEEIDFCAHKFKEVRSLKLIEANKIDYSFKYLNRKNLNLLYKQRGNCDDIIIVKNNCITDSYTANLVFFDGNEWWTPDTPLLSGTQRAKLIAERKISVRRITANELQSYKMVGLINAMWNMKNMPIISIKNIKKDPIKI